MHRRKRLPHGVMQWRIRILGRRREELEPRICWPATTPRREGGSFSILEVSPLHLRSGVFFRVHGTTEVCRCVDSRTESCASTAHEGEYSSVFREARLVYTEGFWRLRDVAAAGRSTRQVSPLSRQIDRNSIRDRLLHMTNVRIAKDEHHASYQRQFARPAAGNFEVHPQR